MPLTLLVPELIWPEPDDATVLDRLPCPALQTLLARGTLRRDSAQAFESTLATLCGGTAQAPFGALRLAGELAEQTEVASTAGSGEWLCADPVHLHFHHEQIVLADPGSFDLSEAESRQFAADLSREFTDFGEFMAPHPRRWYVRLTAPQTVATEALSCIAGRRLTTRRSGDGNDHQLRQILSEIQIWLHNHPLNQAREAAGQPTVNSIWFWGSGPLPRLAAPFARIVGATPLARGIATAAGLAATELPERLDQLPATAGEHTLVVLDQLLEPTLYERGDDWRAALACLEADWFAPALAGLGSSSLAIVAPTIYGTLHWQIAAGARWRFWQRPQPLAHLARKLSA
jgi:hypothetical protein